MNANPLIVPKSRLRFWPIALLSLAMPVMLGPAAGRILYWAAFDGYLQKTAETLIVVCLVCVTPALALLRQNRKRRSQFRADEIEKVDCTSHFVQVKLKDGTTHDYRLLHYNLPDLRRQLLDAWAPSQVSALSRAAEQGYNVSIHHEAKIHREIAILYAIILALSYGLSHAPEASAQAGPASWLLALLIFGAPVGLIPVFIYLGCRRVRNRQRRVADFNSQSFQLTSGERIHWEQLQAISLRGRRLNLHFYHQDPVILCDIDNGQAWLICRVIQQIVGKHIALEQIPLPKWLKDYREFLTAYPLNAKESRERATSDNSSAR